MAGLLLGIVAASGSAGAIPLTGSTSFYPAGTGAGSCSISAGYDPSYSPAPLPVELQQLAVGQVVYFANTEYYGYNIDGMALTVTYVTYSYPDNYISFLYEVVSSADESTHDAWANYYPVFDGPGYFGSSNLTMTL